MWIVRLALRRPYTFVVAALLVNPSDSLLSGASVRIGRSPSSACVRASAASKS